MKPPLVLACSLLAACGNGGDGDYLIDNREGQATANQVARLATAAEEKNPQATVRLEPLAPEDLAGAGLSGAGCAFTVGGLVLLAATPGDSLVKIEGELRHFVQSAPLDATGAFLEDRQLSISVGRDEAVAGDDDAVGRWPARLTVTNRRAEVQQRVVGTWSCAA